MKFSTFLDKVDQSAEWFNSKPLPIKSIKDTFFIFFLLGILALVGCLAYFVSQLLGIILSWLMGVLDPVVLFGFGAVLVIYLFTLFCNYMDS